MRFLKLIILIFLLGSPVLVNAQVIKWQENRPLVWEDFQGGFDRRVGAVAVISSRMAYSYHVEVKDSTYLITFNLECLFDQKSSWRMRGYSDEYVLGHEQLHFDITELCIRKLAAAFRSAVYTANYKAEIDAIYNKYLDERNQMQYKYDTESHHSDDRNMQLKWQLAVYLDLKSLPRNY